MGPLTYYLELNWIIWVAKHSNSKKYYKKKSITQCGAMPAAASCELVGQCIFKHIEKYRLISRPLHNT